MRTILIILLALTVRAGAVTVTTTADDGPGSLRQAIINGSNIDFDPSLNGQVIGLTTGELVIDRDLSISGPGSSFLAVARMSPLRFRIFSITAGHVVTITGLTIREGYADASFGAGILNYDSTLTVSGCDISNNFSDAGDGGGGIYSFGILNVVNSTIHDNRAGFTTGFPLGYGGGIKSIGALTVIDSVISENTADIDGGGIHCRGSLRVSGSITNGNDGGDIAGFIEDVPVPTPTASPTPSPTATPTSTATPAPSPSPTPSATATPTPTPQPTVTPGPSLTHLLNISTRGKVQVGDEVMIAGFILGAQMRVVIRGIGPSTGVPTALPDPVLELRNSSGELIAQNDDWQDDPVTASDLLYRHLAPTDPRESGICKVLPVGAYTALLSGKDNSSGIALVEVYGL